MKIALGVAVALSFSACKGGHKDDPKKANAEATRRLQQIARGVELYAVRGSMRSIRPHTPSLPSSIAPTPAYACCDPDKSRLNTYKASDGFRKCIPKRELWQGEGWRTLGFDVNMPSFFQYELVTDKNHFIARAIGDPHCDGSPTIWELVGGLKDGRVVFGKPHRVKSKSSLASAAAVVAKLASAAKPKRDSASKPKDPCDKYVASQRKWGAHPSDSALRKMCHRMQALKRTDVVNCFIDAQSKDAALDCDLKQTAVLHDHNGLSPAKNLAMLKQSLSHFSKALKSQSDPSEKARLTKYVRFLKAEIARFEHKVH